MFSFALKISVIRSFLLSFHAKFEFVSMATSTENVFSLINVIKLIPKLLLLRNSRKFVFILVERGEKGLRERRNKEKGEKQEA